MKADEHLDNFDQAGEAADSYLWDKSGHADPQIVQLERTLQSLGHQGGAMRLPQRRQWRIHPVHAIAAGLVLVVSISWNFMQSPPEKGDGVAGWAVQTIAGQARIGDTPIADEHTLAVGQWLATDSDDEVRIEVASIGNVTVKPDSRIRLVRTADDEHRMQLASGRIEAFITAPPRLFLVDTPAAVAVDMGCKYDLEVDEHGDGWLAVELGWVYLEAGDREARVPRGARCALRAGAGPGTPHFDDADDALRSAVTAFDEGDRSDSAVEAVVNAARPKDAITLWHLIHRADEDSRDVIATRLLELIGQPAALSADAIARLDVHAMDRCWSELRKTW